MKKTISLVLILVLVLASDIANADFIFGTPTKLGPTVNSGSGNYNPDISSDGLKLYFESERPGGYGSGDLWVAMQPTKDDSWAQTVNLGPTVNDQTLEHDPSISADGLTLYFTSYNRPGSRGGNDLWGTRQATINDPWEEGVEPVNTFSLDVVIH